MNKELRNNLIFAVLIGVPSYYFWRSVDVDPKAVEAINAPDFIIKGALLVVIGGSFMLYKVLKDRKYPFSGKIELSRDENPKLYWICTGFIALAVIESAFRGLQAYVSL